MWQEVRLILGLVHRYLRLYTREMNSLGFFFELLERFNIFITNYLFQNPGMHYSTPFQPLSQWQRWH